MGAGNSHNLSLNCPGAMISSPLQTTPVAQHRQMASYTKSGLVQLPNATILAACISLRESRILFNILIYSILNPMKSFPSTLAHSYDIRIPVVAHCGLSDAPEPLFTSVFYGCCCIHRCRHILTSREEILSLRRSVSTYSEQVPPTTPTNGKLY